MKKKTKKETIEIAMCFNDYDGNYSLLIETAIVSILENNKKNNIRFHLVYNTIPKKNITNIKKLIVSYKQKYKCYPNIENKFKKELNILKKYFTNIWDSSVKYRIYLYEIISKDVKKVLFLDCDVIVIKDLKKLFDFDLTNYYLGSVRSMWVSELKKVIIGGMFLFNLDKIRNEKNILNNIKLILKKLKNKWYFTDEILLNYLFENKIKFFDKKYNLRVNSNISKKKLKNTTILHFFYNKKFNSDYNILSNRMIAEIEPYIKRVNPKFTIKSKIPNIFRNNFIGIILKDIPFIIIMIKFFLKKLKNKN